MSHRFERKRAGVIGRLVCLLFVEDKDHSLLSRARRAHARTLGVQFHSNDWEHIDQIIIMSDYRWLPDNPLPKYFTNRRPAFLSQSISSAAAGDYLIGGQHGQHVGLVVIILPSSGPTNVICWPWFYFSLAGSALSVKDPGIASCEPKYSNAIGQRVIERREAGVCCTTRPHTRRRWAQGGIGAGPACGLRLAGTGVWFCSVWRFPRAERRGNTGKRPALCIFTGSPARNTVITQPWFTTTEVSVTK